MKEPVMKLNFPGMQLELLGAVTKKHFLGLLMKRT